jgi:hypothetical protein
MVEIGDNLPCKLCEQLVAHLRDLLVANTTETEFQQVLFGICKQTKSFASECNSIVAQYYPEIYAFLTKNLNSNFICQMGGVCPAPGKKVRKKHCCLSNIISFVKNNLIINLINSLDLFGHSFLPNMLKLLRQFLKQMILNLKYSKLAKYSYQLIE